MKTRSSSGSERLGLILSAGLAAPSSVISPILSPVSTKLKSSTAAVNKPQEGKANLIYLSIYRSIKEIKCHFYDS